MISEEKRQQAKLIVTEARTRLFDADLQLTLGDFASADRHLQVVACLAEETRKILASTQTQK
jgi:hypothetical protein